MKSITPALLVWLLPAAAAAQIPTQLVALEGTVPTGSGGLAITSLNTPYINALGQVGFTGQLTGTVGFVFVNDQVVWKNNDSTNPVLAGAEGTMGISDSGDFIYSPSADGNDAVYRGSVGILLKATDPAPGLGGLFSRFNSRPTMTPNGTAYWVGGTGTTPTGTTTGRVMFAATGGPATITPLITTSDTVGGNSFTASGLDFNYDFSDDNTQHIQSVIFTGSTATDTAVIVGTPGNLASYSILMREGSPTGQGANWQAFRSANINNAGNHIVIGDDSGATTSDDFLAYNGTIVLRQGQALDGVTLGNTVDASALNNIGQFAVLWDITGGEVLFFGDVANFAGAQEVLRTGDLLDTNGDNVADFTLTDFTASATITNNMDLGDNGMMFLEVTVTPIGGSTAVDAIIGISVAAVPEPTTVGLVVGGLAGGLGWRWIRRRRTVRGYQAT